MYDVVYTRKTGARQGALAGGSAAHTAINESQATRCGAGGWGWGWGWGWGFGDWGEGECGFQVEGRPGGAHGQVEAGGGGEPSARVLRREERPGGGVVREDGRGRERVEGRGSGREWRESKRQATTATTATVVNAER